jgi:hypothetical protein
MSGCPFHWGDPFGGNAIQQLSYTSNWHWDWVDCSGQMRKPKANEQTFLMPFEWMENANLKQVLMTLSHVTICIGMFRTTHWLSLFLLYKWKVFWIELKMQYGSKNWKFLVFAISFLPKSERTKERRSIQLMSAICLLFCINNDYWLRLCIWEKVFFVLISSAKLDIPLLNGNNMFHSSQKKNNRKPIMCLHI